MSSRYLRLGIRPYSVKTAWRLLYSNSRYAYQTEYRDVEICGCPRTVITLNRVVLVAKNIKSTLMIDMKDLHIVLFCSNL